MENNSTNNTRAFLVRLGFRPDLKGFNYIETSLKLCLENPDYLFAITKGLYPHVSEVHNSSISKVERNIRSCIKKAKEAANPAFLEMFKPYESCGFTNSLVLGVLLENIK